MVDDFIKSNNKVNAGADDGLLYMLQHVEYSESHALAEYVDNSIQSYLDNKSKILKINPKYKLQISIKTSGKTITIEDNAAGISDDRFQDAFKAGKIIERRKNKNSSLGEFNMGMKAASYWFTETWKVVTKSIDENKTKMVKMNIHNIVNKSSNLDIYEAKNNSKRGFTKIFLTNCKRSISARQFEKIRETISSIHREFLRRDIVSIKFNDQNIIFTEPEFKKTYPFKEYKNWLDTYKEDLESKVAKKNKPTKVLWRKDINIDFGKNYNAKGYVGILLESKPKIAGFHYFRRKRCYEQNVYPMELFRDSDKGSERYKSIYGEIHFENSDTTFNKRVIEIDDYDLSRFELQLKKELKEFPDLWTQSSVAKERYKEFDEFEAQVKSGQIDKNDEFNVWLKNYKNNSIGAANKALNKPSKIPVLDPSNKLPPLKNPKLSKSEKKETVKIDNKTYTFYVEKTSDQSDSDPWCVWSIDEASQIITVRISMSHEFITTFFQVNNKMTSLGIEYLATYLVTAEIHAQNTSGLGKKASIIRDNLNKILYQLPPRERKRKN
tara:strand:+ start:80 stop:1735 length:1656 start_codon:yes stop_codon:yes gene_type:complete